MSYLVVLRHNPLLAFLTLNPFPSPLLFPFVLYAMQNVIRSNTPINDEMAHQLYVLQVLNFNLLEDRMMTKMDPQDQVWSGTVNQNGWWWV